MTHSRPSWTETFLAVADVMSQRSTCSRRKVGAVLVKDNRIISTGYNGAAPGKTHCTDGGCPRGQLSYAEVPPESDYNQFPCVAIHAEANALLRAGERAAGAVMYITDKPCLQCDNLMAGAGVKAYVVWPDVEDLEFVVSEDEWCNNDLPVEPEVIVVQADVSELPALTQPPKGNDD